MATASCHLWGCHVPANMEMQSISTTVGNKCETEHNWAHAVTWTDTHGNLEHIHIDRLVMSPPD